MKYFVYRNNTIENFLGTNEIMYSGYDDLSYIPEADNYIWFYQVPFKVNSISLVNEIKGYINKIYYLFQQLPPNKAFIIFSLENLYPLRFIDTDYSVADAISDFNSFIRELAVKSPNVKVIDFSEFTKQYESSQLIDWKYYFLSQSAINPKLARSFHNWFKKKIEEIYQIRKKCLVLDLDNTLWGGVLGEEGINGIKIGGDYPGKAFLYFQEGLVELSKNGILLTVCSKNNEADVLAAWKENPFIVLKQEYFASYKINWQNKAENIKALAKELNIGLDSMVFIDDNPTERELVKQLLPMVEVPDFPEHPYQLPAFFIYLVNTYFRTYSITNEDRQKNEQYKANAARAEELRKYTNFEDYLASLNLQLNIEEPNRFSITRIAQLTQKTNQFNLTTFRYTDSDIRQFIDKKWQIYCLSVKDKFGDNGITGVIMLEPQEEGMLINTFLLSCRILGKGIEEAFIYSVINELFDKDIHALYATYIPTKKNIQVADFYEKCGFYLLDIDKLGNKKYKMNIHNKINIKPYYKVQFL